MLHYYTIPPLKNLAHFVRSFWVLEGQGTIDEPFVYHSTADGCAEMIFHYKGRFIERLAHGTLSQSFSMIHAQSSRSRLFSSEESFGIFGVYLYPYALPQLFRLPCHEFTNEMPGLKDLLNHAGAMLEEQMMLANTTLERVQIISSFLEKQLQQPAVKDVSVHAAIHYVLHASEFTPVSLLAKKFNTSSRNLERKFNELAGFTPKLLSRIVRFQSAIKEYINKQQSLTDIAHHCGYYDQSHFIHDFKLFSGYSPKQYFSAKKNRVEWWDVE